MANLVPMAGEGKRFKDVGYAIPKPLIAVDGKPMIVRAIEGMPESDKWIFVCRQEHLKDHALGEILEEAAPGCRIITVGKTTEGQLSSCLLAKDLLERDEELFIGACDNSMLWDKQKLRAIRSDGTTDALVWTFTKQMTLATNPNAWGWVRIEGGKAAGISVKKPISDNPFHDQAVVGSFWFKKAATFIDAAEEMVRKDLRVNGEFYVDAVMNELVRGGKTVRPFLVDKYVGFGTPNDLKTYEYWRGYFSRISMQ